MRVRLFFLFLLICGFINAQEKRLALVIGNANYDKGALKNPVNDALLMKETFEKLGFDVILKTNVETRTDFINVVEEYNKIRKNYTIGFVYYAGHGVQIGGDNYLLPTKELYETENHFKYKGVPISIFTDEWDNPYSNEVNVLILDACRNNPLEKQIFGSTRNVIDNGGLGLAEMKKEKQPTGSIVAFSTAAGQTASDGKTDEKNSFYCKSLAKNMLLVDVSIRNIFGKVSKEIYTETKQYPEVSDKMFDVDFYLTKSTYADEIILIDSLIDEKIYDLALEKVSIVLIKSPNNKKALLRRGRIEYKRNFEYNGFHLFKADSLYPNDPEVYEYIGRYYSTIGEVEKAIKYMDNSIKIDPNEPQSFYWRARFFEEIKEQQKAENDYTQSLVLDSTVSRYVDRAEFYERTNKIDKALKDYTQAISMDKENPKLYNQRANCYILNKDFTAALKDLDKAIDLAPNDPYYYNNRADFYKDYKNETELALKDYATALKLSKDPSQSSRALNNRASIYENQEKFDLALEEYTKAIEIYPKEPVIYTNRASIYQKQQNYELALAEYIQAISYDKENPRWYTERAVCYIAKEDFTAALKDMDKAIDLAPNDPYYYINRADFYREQEKYDEALKDYATALKLSNDPSQSSRALNNRAIIYEDQEKFDLAIEEYTKALEIYPKEPLIYTNRARIYAQQGKLTEALQDYTKAIELDNKNGDRYFTRALFYEEFKEDYDNALIDFSKAIDLAPTNVNYLYQRGVFYKETLNKNKKALDDFEKILEIDSTDIDALNYIGVILEDEGKYDLAIAHYEKGIALENINAESAAFCYRNRAAIFIKQNKFSEALKDFNKAIEISNEKSYSYQDRGDFFISLGEYDKALIDLSLAIENTTTEKSYYFYRRAELYKEYFKNQDNAYEDYKKSIELDSTNRDALIGICEYKKSQGEINQAIKILDDWHSNIDISDSIRSDYLVLKGMYNSAEGEIDEANKYYNKATEIDSKNAIIFYQRGMFYEYYLNDLENAIKDYSKAIELEPENTEYYLRRSDVFFKLGNFKSQNKDILKVRKIDSKSIDFIGKEALVYASQGDFKKAIELSNEAISVSPENYMAYLYKAKVLIKNKDFSGSEDILKKVMEMEPNDPEAFFLMGKIYENKGENFNAAYMFGITENKFTKGNFIISDDLGNTVEKSEVYYEIGLFYEKMKAYDLMRKMFSISINLISQNQLYRLNEIKIEIQEKLKNCQN